MIGSLPIHTPNTQYPSSGSGGDITSEEDKSNIKIENDEQEFSPVYDEQEDEVNSAFSDEGNDVTIDIPDIVNRIHLLLNLSYEIFVLIKLFEFPAHSE